MSGQSSYRVRVAITLAVAALTVPILVFGQSAVLGTIGGVITDPSGAVIPGVTVNITNIGNHQTLTTTTNASGFYTIPNLQSGNYDVIAEKTGFQRCENKSVHLDPAGNVQLRCQMKVGQTTQTVTVTAPTVHVQTNQAQVSRIVNNQEMEQLPTNGRNFVSLLGLQPGVIQSFSFNSFQGMSLFASQCTQVNGLSGESNNILVDGAPSTRTRANGAIVAMPSEDAISEVNIVTNSYMPEYSRGAGGQIIVTMKSGTTNYHGGAFEFLRNDAFDARNFFSANTGELRWNDFGFDIGGPVIPKHNKLFFYWTEEWYRQITASVGTDTVPSLADRAGDFTNYCLASPSTCPKVPGNIPASLLAQDGLTVGAPFPNNTIPTNLWAMGGSLGLLFLKPNLPGTSFGEARNFQYNYPAPNDARQDDIRVDFIPTDRNHLAVSLRHWANASSSPAGDSNDSQLLHQGFEFPSRSGSVDLTSTFSPTLLNDFTVTGSEDIVHVLVPGGPGLDRTALGITYPYILGAASKDIVGKIPTVDIAGYNNISGLPYPSGSTGHIYTIQDVITKIQGNHTIKTGIWWEHDGENDHDQVRVSPGGGVGNNLNGQFTFDASNPNSTGSGLADALLGNFDNYSELGWRDYTPWHAFQVGVFGQDSWKATPRLTIQGGLRWDYFQPYRSAWCNFAMFQPLFYNSTPGIVPVIDPTTGQVVGGNPFDGIGVPCNALPNSAIGHFAVFGNHITAQNIGLVNADLRNSGMLHGSTPSIIGSQFGNWQPRVGFSYDPTGHGTTAIRGGLGIFYNHNTLSDVTLMGGNTPFQLATEVFAAPGVFQQAANPGGTAGAKLPIPMTGQDLLNKTPVVYQWSFTVEHMFSNSTMVNVGYVGDEARNFQLNADENQPALGTFNNPANTAINTAALRPFPGIGGAMSTEQEGSSGYNSLQVSVQHRLTSGLQFGLAYTYSKTMDLGSSIYAVATDTYDPGYNWALADFDRTHDLVATYVYDLPFLKNSTSFVGKAIGGWELSGDVALQSGTPSNVTANGDILGNGVTSISGNEYAPMTPGCAYKGNRSLTQFFNTTCFSASSAPHPSLGGLAPRNLIRGPGTDNWDLALIKNGPIGERVRYQFRAEFFNILNHASKNGIDTGVTDSSFGQVTSASDPREIQFGLKLNF